MLLLFEYGQFLFGIFIRCDIQIRVYVVSFYNGNTSAVYFVVLFWHHFLVEERVRVTSKNAKQNALKTCAQRAN